MSSVRPVNGRVAVVRAKAKEKEGALYIPSEAREVPIYGTVRWVDEGDMTEGVNVGDTVIFTKHTGTEVGIDGETLLFIKGEDILAVYEK